MDISLTQGIHRSLQQNPQGVATRFGARVHTWSRFADRTARFAAALQKLGLKAGDRVAMLGLNSDRYLEYFVGTWWAGGVLNPCNVRWNPQEIVFSLDDCETKILLLDDNFVKVFAALKTSKSVQTFIHVGDGPAPEGMLSYEALVAGERPVEDAVRGGKDLAGIFYTGGTTGTPKGVMLTHENIAWSSLALGTEYPPDEKPQTYMHAAPMFHMADGAFSVVCIIRGASHAFVPSFTPKATLEVIESAKVTVTLLVPTMIQMLVDSPDFARHDVSSLRTVFYGASCISESVLTRAMKALPQAGFTQAYGMTELSPVATVLPRDRHVLEGPRAGKVRSGGRASLCTEVRIVGPDDVEVPLGTVGEVAVRGPNVMLGYWNKPELTAETLRGGWMHTGDGAYMDEDGYIFVVDRLKDMIVSGGENVYSAEVENALARHAAVAMCAVIPVPDEKWGERVHAVVVLKPGQSATAEELIAHCQSVIANYKSPRTVEFRTELPISGAGKILKTVLREPYWKDVSRRVG